MMHYCRSVSRSISLSDGIFSPSDPYNPGLFIQACTLYWLNLNMFQLCVNLGIASSILRNDMFNVFTVYVRDYTKNSREILKCNLRTLWKIHNLHKSHLFLPLHIFSKMSPIERNNIVKWNIIGLYNTRNMHRDVRSCDHWVSHFPHSLE